MFVSIPLFIYLIERVDELKKFNVSIGITDRDIVRKINIVFMILIGYLDMYIGYNWAFEQSGISKGTERIHPLNVREIRLTTNKVYPHLHTFRPFESGIDGAV